MDNTSLKGTSCRRESPRQKHRAIFRDKYQKKMMLCISALTLACTGISLTAYAASSGTTTLGTRQMTSLSNPAITTNADAKWTSYSRDIEYPRTYQYPLEFIDTTEGGKIAVRVTVPADAAGNPIPAAFPVVLTQNAYRIDLGGLLGSVLPSQTTLLIGGEDKFLIRRGYISVTVDVRGTGMSSGVTELIGEEEQAGYADTVEWINQQPWFDGNLGLAGTSYLGITSLLTAAQQHPSVKAVFAEVPMGDSYRGTAAPGGLLNAEFINIWLTLTQTLSVANQIATARHPEYADQIDAATQDHIDAIDAWYLPTVNNALAGEIGYATDDGNFWAVRSPIEHARNIRVPTFIIGSTNDIFQRGQPLLYEQLKRNTDAKLVILPGSHLGAVVDSMLGNRINGGAPGSEELLLRWFDQHLKNIDTGAESMPNVTQYVEGYGLLGMQRFTTSTDWPHPKAKPQRFYLRGNMALSKKEPYYFEWPHKINEPDAPNVSVVKAENGRTVDGTVTINDDSKCSSSGVQWSLGINGLLPLPCHSDSRYVETRQDALIYETSPLLSDMYINGPMQADIWMSATKAHAALSVRVDLVSPLGKATPVTTGLQSAALRTVDTSRSRYIDGVMIQPWHPFTAASTQPLKRNEPVMVPVEIFPAAVLVRAGHRLRIAISASNQVEGIWPIPIQNQVNGNVTTIYNNSKYPSSFVVPVVPTSELR